MPFINKVIFGDRELINLVNDTVDETKVLSGVKFHLPSGASALGSCTFNADTSNDGITAAAVLNGITFHNTDGALSSGIMPNNEGWSSTLSSRDSAISIPAGYHDGSGSVALSSADIAALVSSNVRQGITILGVVGNMTGSEDVKSTSFSTTPYTTSKIYSPTDFGDYNYFSQVTVDAIAYATTTNAAGGITATIGTVAPI